MLKRGVLFEHRLWRSADGSGPLVCRVTQVRAGCVYYRPVYAPGKFGKPVMFGLDEAARYVGRVLAPRPADVAPPADR